ncbi:unnamed protein product, partial [Mesorhabditis belari]|uniref:POU-specific domain-containing protein n=1 Tax=Mesorhabditis belari TaxID=2138241 RepID=A0AAF3FE74_9BILA
MSEPQSSLPTHTATGHTTTSDTSSEATPEVTSEELLLRLQTALGGNIDVQQLLAQMINTGPLGMPPFTSFVQPKTETDEHLLAVLQNQIANTAAQQQILALTSAVPFNPSTPIETSFTASTSKLTHSESPSTSTRPASQPQRAQKRKLFESVQGSSTGGSGASSSSGTLRGSSLEGMSRDERIEIEDLEQFAALFKKQRIKFGFTQGDVGQALGKRYGTDFSQTTISRFEAMNLSFKNMCKLRPLLKEWLTDAERAIANGASVSELIDPVPSPSSNLPLSSLQANERHTASRIVDLMEEDPPTNPIPGDHSLLVTNDPIDEDPDLYEWTNHLWNGQERPSNSERGNDWRTFWNHNSWNGTDFNAGLRWRGRGGEWEMRGCGEGMDEYRVQEWPTTASGAIGWEMVDTTVDLFGDLAVFDDD